MSNHDLYETGDPGAPDQIKDGNGEVVLGLCKRCGKAEVDLDGPCVPKVRRDLSPTLALLSTKLDTLRFAGLDQNPFGFRDLLGGTVFVAETLENEIARLREAAHGATVITNQASDTIKKQGVRIAHLEARLALLAEVAAVLDKIMTCELAQRVGGPDPDDLQALDNALTEAVTLACTLRDRIAATPVPEALNG